MKLSYAIIVCNESKDLYALVSFLKRVKDPEDEINILLDTLHTTDTMRSVLEHFKDDIVLNERDFCGNFSDHRNFHLTHNQKVWLMTFYVCSCLYSHFPCHQTRKKLLFPPLP